MSTPLFVNPDIEELRKSIDVGSGKLAVEISPEQMQFFVNLMTRTKFYTEMLFDGLSKEQREGITAKYIDKEVVRQDVQYLQHMIDAAQANETVACTILPISRKEYATQQAQAALAQWREVIPQP